MASITFRVASTDEVHGSSNDSPRLIGPEQSLTQSLAHRIRSAVESNPPDKALYEVARRFDLKSISSMLAAGVVSETARNTALYFLSRMDRSSEIEKTLDTLFEQGPLSEGLLSKDIQIYALITASKRGDCALMSQILKKCQISEDVLSYVICCVCRDGNLTVLKHLLTLDVLKEALQEQVLIMAVRADCTPIVQELLKRNLGSETNRNQAFALVVTKGNLLICKEFLEKGGLSKGCRFEALSIALSTHKTHFLIIEVLIESLITSGDFSQSDVRNVLLLASENHYFGIVRVLRMGHMITDESLRSEALEVAARVEVPTPACVIVLEELVQSGLILPEKRDQAFIIACCAAQAYLIEALIENSAIGVAAKVRGGVAIIAQGRCDLFEKLVESDIFSTDCLLNILHFVISKNNLKMLEILLAKVLFSEDLKLKGLLTIVMQSNRSMLLLFMQKLHISDLSVELALISLIQRNGPHQMVVDLLDYHPLTEEALGKFLLEAVTQNRLEIVQELVKRGLISEHAQKILFQRSIETKHFEIFKELLKHPPIFMEAKTAAIECARIHQCVGLVRKIFKSTF